MRMLNSFSPKKPNAPVSPKSTPSCQTRWRMPGRSRRRRRAGRGRQPRGTRARFPSFAVCARQRRGLMPMIMGQEKISLAEETSPNFGPECVQSRCFLELPRAFCECADLTQDSMSDFGRYLPRTIDDCARFNATRLPTAQPSLQLSMWGSAFADERRRHGSNIFGIWRDERF